MVRGRSSSTSLIPMPRGLGTSLLVVQASCIFMFVISPVVTVLVWLKGIDNLPVY